LPSWELRRDPQHLIHSNGKKATSIHSKAALEELHPSHTDNEGKVTVQHPASKLRQLSIDILPSLNVQQLSIWADESADGPQCCLGWQLRPGVLLERIGTSAASHSHTQQSGGHV